MWTGLPSLRSVGKCPTSNNLLLHRARVATVQQGDGSTGCDTWGTAPPLQHCDHRAVRLLPLQQEEQQHS